MNESIMNLSNTIIDIDGNSQPISSLLVGAEATIIFITPYAFDDLSSNTMEKLIKSMLLQLQLLSQLKHSYKY
jgi:hypothetical protein